MPYGRTSPVHGWPKKPACTSLHIKYLDVSSEQMEAPQNKSMGLGMQTQLPTIELWPFFYLPLILMTFNQEKLTLKTVHLL